MKINFAEIKFRPSLFEAAIVDKDLLPTKANPDRRPISWQIANALWQSKEIEKAKVGERIYDNYGKEIELTDTEVGYVKEVIENFNQWVRTPILEAIGE